MPSLALCRDRIVFVYTDLSAMEVMLGSGSETPGGCRTAGGRIFGTLFFLVFFLMGAGFAVAILVAAYQEAAVWVWPEVECTILSAGVEETGDDRDPYRPTVAYSYTVDGRTFEGHTLTRADATTSSYDTARGPSDRYPVGAQTACRVNPDDPSESVLERRPPWIVFVVLLPLIFVAVGAGGIIFIWRKSPAIGGVGRLRSISERARGGRNLGRRVELGVGLIFVAVGGVVSVFLLVLPAVRLVSALDWVETPATITASTLRSWSSDDGTSYAADILYEYDAGGRSWLSNRRSFFPMGSSGYEGAHATVERYPAGSSTTCHVDPDDPSRSVLENGFRPAYLIGLFPLIFLFVGLGVTAHALRARPPGTPATTARTQQPEHEGVERVLEPAAGPLAKIAGMLIVALFWNGIVSVFVWQAVQGFLHGSPEWFLTVFLIPFVLIGLALIGGIFYTVLAAFNPRPRLTISPAAPRLGTAMRVDWTFAGAVSRIERLRIVLEGSEKATYRRGTDTHTDREVFASFELIETSAEWEISRGTTEIAIPEDTMHSFASANNAVEWSLSVHGDIPHWPDVMESYDIEVRPLSRERMLP